MTDRGLPSADGSPACPFVAFEDDRDERADRPDHRHRCFAEIAPAPRALAHQEAYCLSSAFPVCPTFQDWARREAAQARPGGAATPTAATVSTAGLEAGDDDDDDPSDAGHDETPVEERPRRNPPRDWAAPPPWAGGPAGAAVGRGGAESDVAAEFLASRTEEGRGLAGSAADRLAGGEDLAEVPMSGSGARAGAPSQDSPAAPPDPELAGLVGRVAGRHSGEGADGEGYPPTARPGRRPTVSSTRDRGRDRDRERERERTAAAERSGHQAGPSWERQRRFEAYPTIRTRAGLSGIPPLSRITVLLGALIVAAVALFFLPALLGVGGRDGAPTASPSPSSAVATPTPQPTPIPEPTPQVYVIKAGDTLSRIARAFGITLDQLLAANKDTITDPNRIAAGDEIIIPTPPPVEVDGGEASPSPSP